MTPPQLPLPCFSYLVKAGVFCTHGIPEPLHGIKAYTEPKGNIPIKCSLYLLHSFSGWARQGLRQVACGSWVRCCSLDSHRLQGQT